MSEAAIRADGVTMGYDGETVVQNLSFALPHGSLVGVIGPNGAGKSTLIKGIVGAKDYDEGSIEVLGKPAREGRRDITYVPQRGEVDWDFPITARSVVRQGRYGSTGLLGRFKERDREAVAGAMRAVGVEDLGDRQIGALSGGQRQRVFLARALAQGGEIFVLDEPFAGVDVATETAIIEVLKGLRDQGKTVIVVHHDLATVRDYFDHLMLLNRRLVAVGSTEEVFVKESLRETYGGRVAIIDGSSGDGRP